MADHLPGPGRGGKGPENGGAARASLEKYLANRHLAMAILDMVSAAQPTAPNLQAELLILCARIGFSPPRR
ncbi:hypothetical protein [Acidocella sp.]|uniref:hypothetical protein n=1 Tax=Acidocella sp. TaxID=50710 RepID=UPI00262FEEB5|nr:hypothetical protein [Acidocella sp.]